jgi:hypothetical protein
MQIDEVRFREYRNEFPVNTIKAWSKQLEEQAKWSFSGWTGEPKEPLRHWAYVSDYESTGILGEIWVAIASGLREDGFNLKPQRILMNLFNHGDSSWLHKDSQYSKDWTVILYMNDYWDINWGGDTVLVEDNEILHSCAPTPGKMFLFRSDLLHGARPVSREAPFPRFGLTYQCAGNAERTI